MRHAPYGYRIENGRAVIDEMEAEQVKKLFQAYLDGASLTSAGIAAGIETFHTGSGRMLKNRRYLGDGYYPAIIDSETFAAACDARTMQESAIEEVLVRAINQALCGKRDFLAVLQGNIETVLRQKNDQALADIDERLEELQIRLVKLASSNADYGAVGDEIYRLRDEKQRLLIESANRDEQLKRIDDMGAFLREHPSDVTEYDERLVRRLIEKVTVFDESFSVEFKSGVMVEVAL